VLDAGGGGAAVEAGDAAVRVVGNRVGVGADLAQFAQSVGVVAAVNAAGYTLPR